MRKKGWIAAGAVLGVLVLLVVTAVILLFSDPGFDGPEPSPMPEDAGIRAAKSLVTGDSFHLETAELCGMLVTAAQEHPVSWLDADGLRVRTQDGQLLTLYVPAVWNGKTLYLTAELEVRRDAVEKRLEAQVLSLSVGKLPVPVDWVLERIADRLPEGVRLTGDVLSVPAELPLLALEENRPLAALEVRELTLTADGVDFAFAVNADGTASLLEEGKDWLENLLGFTDF